MGVVVTGGYISQNESNLTIKSDSVYLSDDGDECLIYHIRRIGRRQITLTDAHNKPLLILHRKVVSLRGRWEGFAGKGEKPIFSVRRSSVIGRSGLSAEAYKNDIAGKFRIEGSSDREKRSFTVHDIRNKAVTAEIRRGGDGAADEGELMLWVTPGGDTAFAAGLAIVLGQIGGGLVGA